jgi:CBS domain-containing protein
MAVTEFGAVLYTRGEGCAELAAVVHPEPVRVGGDLAKACVEARADLLVTRRPPGGFDLVSVAVPVHFEPGRVRRVVATVAGGPHSVLAAGMAELIGSRLGVGIVFASAYFDAASRPEAEAALERLAGSLPEAERMLIAADDVSGFVGQLPDQALLVMGEPGGSLLSRLFFGPGAKLRAAAAGGTVRVRSAPSRVFHVMGEPVFVGPLHPAGDTLRLYDQPLLAVVENGILVGMVRRTALEQAGAWAPVGDLMETPRAVLIDQSLEDAMAIGAEFDRGPLPVTDSAGRLVGTIHLPAA